jgi:uncharacterized protein (TIGR02246 family)
MQERSLAAYGQPVHRMKATLVVAILAASCGMCLAEESGSASPEWAAVTANARAYEAAFEKGDVKALTDFFSEEAEYTTDDGRNFSGSKEIESAVRAAMTENKGAKLSINVATVKVLAPEVVLEKGSTRVTSKTGESTSALYTIIHVKKGDKWKISQLIETPLPDVTPHDRVSELAWLIGEWEDVDKSNDLTVRSQFTWARGENFISRNMTVKRAAKVILEGWQVIGWDPVEERVHSWTFDAEGGFSEGLWTRDGDRWLVRESGVNPAGGRITADNTISKLSADRFSWQSSSRTLDGEPQPGIDRIEIARVKGS